MQYLAYFGKFSIYVQDEFWLTLKLLLNIGILSVIFWGFKIYVEESMLYHAMENTVDHTTSVTYARCMMERLDVIP